jgi:hypothetical protein
MMSHLSNLKITQTGEQLNFFAGQGPIRRFRFELWLVSPKSAELLCLVPLRLSCLFSAERRWAAKHHPDKLRLTVRARLFQHASQMGVSRVPGDADLVCRPFQPVTFHQQGGQLGLTCGEAEKDLQAVRGYAHAPIGAADPQGGSGSAAEETRP